MALAAALSLGLLGGCSGPTAPPVPSALAPAPAAGSAAVAEPGAVPAAAEAWPGQGRCDELVPGLAALPAGRRQGLAPEASPMALAVIDRGVVLPAEAADLAVARDVPLPVAARLDGPAPCLLLVDRGASVRAAARRPVAHELVRSAYRRGTRRTPSQERADLERAAREVGRGGGPEVLATGDPGVDLIGLLAGSVLDGIDLFRRRSEAERLRAARAATPAAVEEPVWEPYTYDVTTVEAARFGSLRAALVDRGRGRGWRINREVREVRTFRVAAGRSPRDRDLIEGRAGTVALPADVEVWELGGLRPRVSELLALLAEAIAAGRPEAASPATVVAGWAGAPNLLAASPAAASPDGEPEPEPAAGPVPRSAEGAEGAAGCPPRPAAAGRASLVEQVAAADGTRRYRLVAAAPDAPPPPCPAADPVTDGP